MSVRDLFGRAFSVSIEPVISPCGVDRVIVPVIDMRVKFKLAEVRYDSFTVVVILRIAGRVIGLVVDGVSDVVRFAESEVKAAPQLGSVVDGSFIAGLATQGERMVLLLDIEKLLSSGELNILRASLEAAT